MPLDQLTIVQAECSRLLEDNRVLQAQVSGLRHELEALSAGRRLYGALNQVRDFHVRFGVPILMRPSKISEERMLLRLELIREECCDELLPALCDQDLPAIADGLADLIYVCLGAALEFGIPLGMIFDDVHSANMRKDGGPTRDDGKILKPEGWIPPNIGGILRMTGWGG